MFKNLINLSPLLSQLFSVLLFLSFLRLSLFLKSKTIESFFWFRRGVGKIQNYYRDMTVGDIGKCFSQNIEFRVSTTSKLRLCHFLALLLINKVVLRWFADFAYNFASLQSIKALQSIHLLE